MPIDLGSTDLSRINLGTPEVTRVHLGGESVYSSGPASNFSARGGLYNSRGPGLPPGKWLRAVAAVVPSTVGFLDAWMLNNSNANRMHINFDEDHRTGGTWIGFSSFMIGGSPRATFTFTSIDLAWTVKGATANVTLTRLASAHSNLRTPFSLRPNTLANNPFRDISWTAGEVIPTTIVFSNPVFP